MDTDVTTENILTCPLQWKSRKSVRAGDAERASIETGGGGQTWLYGNERNI